MVQTIDPHLLTGMGSGVFLVPTIGFELMTYRLQGDCTTTVLIRRILYYLCSILWRLFFCQLTVHPIILFVDFTIDNICSLVRASPLTDNNLPSVIYPKANLGSSILYNCFNVLFE